MAGAARQAFEEIAMSKGACGLMVLSLFGALIGVAQADDTFRCGNKLVQPGMTRAEVQQLCGPPTAQADEVHDVRSAGRVVGKTTVHRWTYTTYSRTRVLVFDQEVLKSIENE
jgi:hypothetical protein